MKIVLNEDELKLLKKANISIKAEKDYSKDEIESLLDDIYFNESTNVGYDNELARKYAHIADKVEKQVD